jgi:hypothetical protein
MEKVNPGEIINEQDQAVSQVFDYIVSMLMHEKIPPEAAVDRLVEKGIDRNTAENLVDAVDAKVRKAKKDHAYKNMAIGALWCIGGIVATASGIGLIFWGAILFGAIQFFQGVASL